MATLDELARAGMAAIEERRFDDAVKALSEAQAQAPDRPDMNHLLGMAWLRRGDAGSAVPFLEKAVALSEGFADPRYDDLKRQFQVGLASALELADRVPAAQRVLEGLVRRWPHDGAARIQLANLLLSTARPHEGIRVLRDATAHLDGDAREAAEALAGAVEAFLETEEDALVFLQANQESYRAYFDEIAREQEQHGWLPEAMRMSRGPDGEPRAFLAKGARPYALQRVDLVNPADNATAGVYSEKEPMVVALDGVEPLAQAAVLLPSRGAGFEVWISSQSPWHWLRITVQFVNPAAEAALVERIDGTFGEWYLNGFNGEFGDRTSGRFHYVGDPEVIGDRAVSYVVDLGRASLDAIGALLRRLGVLNEVHPIRRVVIGFGRLPD